MPSYDERFQAFEEEDRLRRRAAARDRVALPALVLILSGTFGLIVELTTIGVSVQRPTALADYLAEWVEGMPAGADKERLTKQLKDGEAGLRLDTPQNIGGCVVGAVVNFLMIAGGIAMRSLGSFGLGMTGAIAGLVPVGGCCCLAMPVGIWALVTLQRADVKAAFAARQSLLEDGY